MEFCIYFTLSIILTTIIINQLYIFVRDKVNNALDAYYVYLSSEERSIDKLKLEIRKALKTRISDILDLLFISIMIAFTILVYYYCISIAIMQ